MRLKMASLSSVRPTTLPPNMRSKTGRKLSIVLFWALSTHLGVGHPGLLELVEGQLLPLVEVEAEPLIHLEEKSLAKEAAARRRISTSRSGAGCAISVPAARTRRSVNPWGQRPRPPSARVQQPLVFVRRHPFDMWRSALVFAIWPLSSRISTSRMQQFILPPFHQQWRSLLQ